VVSTFLLSTSTGFEVTWKNKLQRRFGYPVTKTFSALAFSMFSFTTCSWLYLCGLLEGFEYRDTCVSDEKLRALGALGCCSGSRVGSPAAVQRRRGAGAAPVTWRTPSFFHA